MGELRAERRPRYLERLFERLGPGTGVVLGFLLIVVIGGLVSPYFLTQRNITNVLLQTAMLGAVDDATLLCSTAHERARARSPDLEAQNLNVLLPFDPAAMHENCEAIFLSNCAGQFSVAEMQPTLAVSAKNASKGQGGRSSQGNHTVLK
jgi:hypothetical protein